MPPTIASKLTFASTAERQAAGSRPPLGPAALLIAMLPLGVAAQNLLGLVVVAWCLGILWRQPNRWHPTTWSPFRYGQLLALLAMTVISFNILAVWLNPQNPATGGFAYFLGYSLWCFLPLLLVAVYQGFSRSELERLLVVLSWGCACWALICLSQWLWGWRISGIELISDYHRPRGLFSHPLTLAYSALICWPLASILVLRRPQHAYSWLLFLSIGAIVLASQSRTVQAVCLFFFVVNLFSELRGVRRLVMIVALGAGILVVAVTENPIATKFSQTFSPQGYGRHSEYLDDRLAFWDAHWLMIKERPILGHGFDLDRDYRNQYYDRLGLSNLRNKYEAHNTFIQIWANGGIIALVAFALWLGVLVIYSRRHLPHKVGWWILQATVVWILAALTQNALQDSEPRFALTLFACAVLMWPGAAQNKYPQA